MNSEALLWSVAITAIVVANIVLVALAVIVHRRWQAAFTQAKDSASEGAALLTELRALAATQTALQAELQKSHTETLAATEALRLDVRALSSALGVFGQRLGRIEEDLERRAEAAQPVGVRTELERKSIEFATRLASRGASADELVELCGLSRGEAELLMRVHAKPGAKQEGAGR